MIIKKFTGKTEDEAVENAKKELGAGVVVMNVREAKKKGIFSFLAPKNVEVTVALEEEPDRVVPTRPSLNPSPKEADIVKKQEAVREEKIKSAENEKKIEKRLDDLQNLLEKQLSYEHESDTSKKGSSEENDLKERLLSPDNDKSKDNEKPAESENVKVKEEGSNVKFLKLLYDTMLENEIDEKYANQIIDELDGVLKPNMPIDFMLSNVYQKMILKFGSPGGVTKASKGPKVVFFVGPTGVGKTTTIAKIASRYSVERKEKVALFTTDTYRIAAAEQLRTYANILEVPFRVIYSADELLSGIEEFISYDYIFIDTAGHSQHNVSQRENMKEFLDAVVSPIEKEAYLVVSATTKYKDLLSIADTYSTLTDYKLIFTKLDETTTLGNLLNLKLHTGADMSYITYGQNVPDDMEDFNPQRTVKLLLGGGSHGPG
ncbi:MAG TPA: flagellar biosynthesis protein FlhF [Lachnospiraceae bacterium]|nr:flagellar biosynthesis protein FlhF [Lachnospiraceae bacterium]